jgi:hypothetical protein
VAAAIDTGGADAQLAAVVGMEHVAQQIVEFVPYFAVLRIAADYFVSDGPAFFVGAEAEHLAFEPVDLHVNAGDEEIHRIGNRSRAVILAAPDQGGGLDLFDVTVPGLAKHGIDPDLHQLRVVLRREEFAHDVFKRKPRRQEARHMKARGVARRFARAPLAVVDRRVAVAVGPDRAAVLADVVRGFRLMLAELRIGVFVLAAFVPAHVLPLECLRLAAERARDIKAALIGREIFAPDHRSVAPNRRRADQGLPIPKGLLAFAGERERIAFSDLSRRRGRS